MDEPEGPYCHDCIHFRLLLLERDPLRPPEDVLDPAFSFVCPHINRRVVNAYAAECPEFRAPRPEGQP
ncbi:MAG: hypothetical protein HYY85_06735 [Deltaproteobacteria bacterium]|nr:hypothetical protein [Deltaproteobacteria bacterium]